MLVRLIAIYLTDLNYMIFSFDVIQIVTRLQVFLKKKLIEYVVKD